MGLKVYILVDSSSQLYDDMKNQFKEGKSVSLVEGEISYCHTSVSQATFEVKFKSLSIKE